jgi:hypothetical protein
VFFLSLLHYTPAFGPNIFLIIAICRHLQYNYVNKCIGTAEYELYDCERGGGKMGPRHAG